MNCRTISNTVHQKPNVPVKEDPMSFEEKRKRTLLFLKSAADKLRTAPKGTLETSKIVFKRGENSSEYPFWNLINGPIADALWHVGQVVSFRRTSGNPWNSNVSVFNGRLRN